MNDDTYSIWSDLNKQLEGRAVLEHIKTDKSGIMMYFETIENICFSIKVFNDEFSFKVKECEYHPINVLESIELVRNFIEEHKTILRMFEFSGDGEYEYLPVYAGRKKNDNEKSWLAVNDHSGSTWVGVPYVQSFRYDSGIDPDNGSNGVLGLKLRYRKPKYL